MRASSLRSAAAVLVAFAFAACSGDDGPSGPQSITVTVAPATVTLTSIGATQQLTATVRDDGGNELTGATVSFDAGGSAAVSVSGSGLVTALTNGSATIAVSASASGLNANTTVPVTVGQVAATVTLTPPTATILVSQTQQLTATAADAQSNPIATPSINYSSSATGIASVDGAGLVTGVAAGTATITASSGGASAQSVITVELQSVTIDADATLGGSLTVDSLTIDPGVTVTLDSDFTLTAMGSVLINGTVQGDCVSVDVAVTGNFTHNGMLANACTAPGESSDVTIVAEGGISVTGGQIDSSGDILVSNAGTTGGEFPVGGLAPVRGPEGAPGDGPLDCTFNSFIAQAIPLKAADDQDGNSVRIFCAGAALFEGGNQIVAQDGGDGSSDLNGDDTTGGDGGDGGDVVIRVLDGDALFEDATFGGAEGTAIRAGDGGVGGDASAQGAGPGGDADALAGDGGNGGRFGLDVPNGVVMVDALGGLRTRMGDAGAGGDADATAVDGMDAGAEPAQAGGMAVATAGDGGNGGYWGFTFTAQGLPNIQQEGANGGSGGRADAVGGNGGDGNANFPNGADGGDIQADGGTGGNSGGAALGTTEGSFGAAGDGGDTSQAEGMGGAGADLCPSGVGGNGGMGGMGPGGPGAAGTGDVAGTDGVGTQVSGLGNGGPGGDGTTPGMGGEGGEETSSLTVFQDGPPGNPCPPIGGTLMVSLVVTDDPANHEPSTQIAATTTQLTAEVSGNSITISGNGNFVGVSGTLDPVDGTFSATGAGMAAGFSTTFSFDGTVTIEDGVVTSITGTYVAGVDGNLNMSGEATTYAVTTN